MKKVWKIEEYNGLELTGTYFVPANLHRTEIVRMIRQLASRFLKPDEIICAGLRRRMQGKANHLDIGDINGMLTVGENPFMTARKLE